MSIQTELTRITNAKAAIKTAIEGKGVTVPDGTMLDGMAALIEAIQAGGSKVVTGTFTLSEDVTGYYYPNVDYSSLIIDGEDNVTVRKRLCFLVALSDFDSKVYSNGTFLFAVAPYNSYGSGTGVSIGYDGNYSNSTYESTIVCTASVDFRLKFSSAKAQIGKAGYTYRYWIWRAFDQ